MYSKLAREIRNRSGLTVESVVLVLQEAVAFIKDELRQGKTVHLPGLGTFRNVYQKPKRVVCNLPGRNKGAVYNLDLRVRPFLQPAKSLCRVEKGTLPAGTPRKIDPPRNEFMEHIWKQCDKEVERMARSR